MTFVTLEINLHQGKNQVLQQLSAPNLKFIKNGAGAFRWGETMNSISLRYVKSPAYLVSKTSTAKKIKRKLLRRKI